MSEQKKLRTGGIESKLESIGTFYLIISILGFIVSIILSLDKTVQLLGLSTLWIVIGIVSILQGIIFWILLKTGSEVIRLLKMLNGLPYGGEISETKGFGREYICTDCGAPVAPNAKFCSQCGVIFDDSINNTE